MHDEDFLAIDGEYNDGFNKLNETNVVGVSCKVSKRLDNLKASLNSVVLYVEDFIKQENTDTEAIQRAVGTDFTKYHTEQPLRKVIFQRGKTYHINSTIFVPPYTDIDFNGATIKALSNGNFTKNYMFSINSEDCANWSFGYYPRVGEIKNGILDGNDVENVRGIFLCSNHRITQMKFWKLYNSIYSPNIYIDNYFLEDIKINYPMGNDYQIYKAGQGDGVHISKVHTPSDIEELKYGNGLHNGGAKILCLKQCGGGVVENIVNGKIEIRTSYGLTLSNLHLETGSLEIYDTNCTVKDSIITKRDEVTDVPIYLNDSNYESKTMGSKPVILDNVQILHYYYLSDYNKNRHDIDVSDFLGVLMLRNTFRRTSDVGLKKTSNCGVTIKKGTDTIYNPYDIVTLKNRKITMKNDECINTMTSYIKNITANDNLQWKKDSGTYYYNACQIIDFDRNVGKSTSDKIVFEATDKGACININYTETHGIIRLYRGICERSYTEFVDIPNPMGIIFDNGISANGYVWKQCCSPISDATVPNIITGIINNGGYAIARGVSCPTSGKWWQGDTVINNIPSEQGEVGSKYIVTGWTCISDGTPGVWVQNKVLTGN